MWTESVSVSSVSKGTHSCILAFCSSTWVCGAVWWRTAGALRCAEASLSAVASAPSFHAFKIQTFFSFLFFPFLFVSHCYRPSRQSAETAHMRECTFFLFIIQNAARLHEAEHPSSVVMKHAIKITWPYLRFCTLRFPLFPNFHIGGARCRVRCLSVCLFRLLLYSIQ